MPPPAPAVAAEQLVRRRRPPRTGLVVGKRGTVAQEVENWAAADVTTAEIERGLAAMRRRCGEDETLDLRTSVLTHLAWVPREWREAADEVLEGLAERHPSRVILLYPEPDDARSRIDVDATVEAFSLPGLEQHVAAEVIRLTILGDRCRAPASIVLPLLLPDLPVFLRWRGPLPYGAHTLEQLVDVTDRLVVCSDEWPDVDAGLGRLPELFERAAVSDISWTRTRDWRWEIAQLWPDVAEAASIAVRGPYAQGRLLAAWLSSRLGHHCELRHDAAETLEAVSVDGREIHLREPEPASPSDLLSHELERYGRDHVYENAVSGITSA